MYGKPDDVFVGRQPENLLNLSGGAFESDPSDRHRCNPLNCYVFVNTARFQCLKWNQKPFGVHALCLILAWNSVRYVNHLVYGRPVFRQMHKELGQMCALALSFRVNLEPNER
jgi:hypothetical protein